MKAIFFTACAISVLWFSGCGGQTGAHISTAGVEGEGGLGYVLSKNDGKTRLFLVDFSAPMGQRAKMYLNVSEEEVERIETQNEADLQDVQPFQIVRIPGTLTCWRSVAHPASGHCHLEIDPGFAAFLAERQIDLPAQNFLLGLISSNVSEHTIDVLCELFGKCPSAIQVALLTTGAGVDHAYALSWLNEDIYPSTVEDMLIYKSLGITPGEAHALSAAGITDLDSRNVIQLKAFNISPQQVEKLGENGSVTAQQALVSGMTPRTISSMIRNLYDNQNQ